MLLFNTLLFHFVQKQFWIYYFLQENSWYIKYIPLLFVWLRLNEQLILGKKKTIKPISFLFLVLQGPQGVLETIRQDFQLLGQLILLTKLLTQQHQVTCGIMQWDVAQVKPPPCQIVQVHNTDHNNTEKEERENRDTLLKPLFYF